MTGSEDGGKQHRYIPALRYRWLTSLYDPLLRSTLREGTFKRRLVDQVGVQSGHKVLDIGCGTGTLTLLLKQTWPGAEVVGLDGDPHVLAIARAKAARSGLDVTFHEGMSFQLPYPDHSFDRVVSSLLFHHLTREDKGRTLQEVFRVLRAGGEIHMADWGHPQNPLMRVAFLAVQLLDGFRTTSDNVKGLLPELLTQAGFEGVKEPAQFATVVGTLSLYAGCRPRTSKVAVAREGEA